MARFTRRGFLERASLAAGLATWAGSGAAGAGEEAVTVAAFNDHHVIDAESTRIVSVAVAAVNALKPVHFTVILGDLTENARPEEFDLVKDALSKLETPYRAVPGNHDVTSTAVSGYRDYHRCFEDANWIEEMGGWTFIGIDSCEGRATVAQIPLRTVLWLNEQLREIPKDRPIALFTHHPFNPNVPKVRAKNADTLLSNFSEHRLKLVAAGHFHGNLEERKDGVLFTTTACCSTTRPNHDLTVLRGFRLFQFKGDEVKTVTVGLGPREESKEGPPAEPSPRRAGPRERA